MSPDVKVWDRWHDGSEPTISGSTTLSLAALAELAQHLVPSSISCPTTAINRTLELPLVMPQLGQNTVLVDHDGEDGDVSVMEDDHGVNDGEDSDVRVGRIRPLLDVQLQYEAVYLPGSIPKLVTSQDNLEYSRSPDLADNADPSVQRPDSAVGVPAVISVSIIQACGLQVSWQGLLITINLIHFCLLRPRVFPSNAICISPYSASLTV